MGSYGALRSASPSVCLSHGNSCLRTEYRRKFLKELCLSRDMPNCASRSRPTTNGRVTSILNYGTERANVVSVRIRAYRLMPYGLSVV